jgi:hypothetical protein
MSDIVDYKKLEARVKDLMEINNEHQKLNGELRSDNKKLSKQIEDLLKIKELEGLNKK